MLSGEVWREMGGLFGWVMVVSQNCAFPRYIQTGAARGYSMALLFSFVMCDTDISPPPFFLYYVIIFNPDQKKLPFTGPPFPKSPPAVWHP